MNYFALEALIRDRLRDQVPELVEIETSTTLVDRTIAHWRPPSALIYLDNERILSADPKMTPTQRAHFAKNTQAVAQNWIVLLALRSTRDATGVAVRNEAGPLISKVIVALNGWAPEEPEYDPEAPPPEPQLGIWWPLVRIDAPDPLYPEPGRVLFPLAFESIFFATTERLSAAP